MSEKTIKEIARDVAIAVATGDGFTIANINSASKEEQSKTYEEIKTVLNRKWHINAIDIEDDFVVFIIESYGENHINRIIKKAQNYINENKAIIDVFGVFIKNEKLIKNFFQLRDF